MCHGCSKMHNQMLKWIMALTIFGVTMLLYTYMSNTSLHVMNNVQIYSDKVYSILKSHSLENDITVSKNLTTTGIVNNLSFKLQKQNVLVQNHRDRNINKNSSETRNNSPKRSNENAPLCKERGENLVGPIFIDQTIPKDMSELEKTLSIKNGGTVERGGWWSPVSCKPRVKVAIVIPYRRRIDQLKIFLKHMHPFLQKQLLEYRIFVVEQLYDDPFNRAGLFNIGFTEALKRGDFNCFILTDVDLLPEDDRNYYGCEESPRHMSVAVDEFHYKLPYATIFGGVCAFTREHFEEVNGMSNLFFGWGGEDDDLYKRVTISGMEISRPNQQVGRYTMIAIGHHRSSNGGANRHYLLDMAEQRMMADGLNTMEYNLKRVAILIPFRNREKQLMIFLRHMHNFLQRQQLYYRIFVVDQLYNDPFNRAALFNIGYTESKKLTTFDCLVFSDVDLLPEDDRNYYGCPTSPRHMSVAVDKFDYRLPYESIFGGVGSFKIEHFLKINGFSNLFWGWGGEDDDLYGRIKAFGFSLTRPSLKIGRYTMLKIHHVVSDKANPNRANLLRDTQSRMSADGLSTLKYKLISLDEEPLVTFIRVELKRSMYT